MFALIDVDFFGFETDLAASQFNKKNFFFFSERPIDPDVVSRNNLLRGYKSYLTPDMERKLLSSAPESSNINLSRSQLLTKIDQKELQLSNLLLKKSLYESMSIEEKLIFVIDKLEIEVAHINLCNVVHDMDREETSKK